MTVNASVLVMLKGEDTKRVGVVFLWKLEVLAILKGEAQNVSTI